MTWHWAVAQGSCVRILEKTRPVKSIGWQQLWKDALDAPPENKAIVKELFG